MREQRICIVSPHFPSDDAIGNYSTILASELCKNTELIVLANKNSKSKPKELIQHPDKLHHYTVCRVWSYNILFPLMILASIIRNKPNLVHIQHEYFLYGKGLNAIFFPFLPLLIKILGITQVVTMHHVIPLKKISYFKSLLRIVVPNIIIKMFLILFNKIFALTAETIIVPSLSLKKTLSNDYRINLNQIEVVPHFTQNVTEISQIEQDKAKSLLGLKKNFVLLFFGYIRPSKGIEYLLYALSKVLISTPNIVLFVIGKAQTNYLPYLNSLKQLVINLQLSQYVRFQDYVPEEQLPMLFAASDVVVFPYISNLGMTPIAHLKAASYGKPIIVSNLECFKQEFVDYENALLVSPTNSNSFSRKIIELISSTELKKKLATNILLYCMDRSKEKAAENTLRIYSKLLKVNSKNLVKSVEGFNG